VSTNVSITTLNKRSGIFTVKLIVVELVKKFAIFNETRKFINIFIRAHHWSLTWARWIQPTSSHTVSLRYILILHCHLHIGLSSYYIHLSCPEHLTFLGSITLIISGKEDKLCSSSLCNFLQLHITSSLLGPRDLISTLFSHYLHGAVSFLRSWQSLSWSRNSSPFMEHEGSRPCSQEPVTVPILSQMNPVQTFSPNF